MQSSVKVHVELGLFGLFFIGMYIVYGFDAVLEHIPHFYTVLISIVFWEDMSSDLSQFHNRAIFTIYFKMNLSFYLCFFKSTC